MLKIIFVGGTKRALNLFNFITESRSDISVEYAVFMRGNPEEYTYSEQLAQLAETRTIAYTISDNISTEIIALTHKIKPDVIIGGGICRSIFFASFFSKIPYGYIWLHGSAVPAYRGWAGLNWYIINGEKRYTMRMLRLDEGVDSGPLIADGKGKLLEVHITLDNHQHVGEILDEVYQHHLTIYGKLFDCLIRNDIKFIPQYESQSSFTCHRGPADGQIDWSQSTREVFNFIRGQSVPYPGAFTYYQGRKIKIWRVVPRHDYSNYIGRIEGKVVTRNKNGSVVILTGDGGIEVTEAEDTVSKEKLPYLIFNSVRRKCTSRLEAYLDSVGFE
jgi:methionyl-tRNA formyltransferase